LSKLSSSINLLKIFSFNDSNCLEKLSVRLGGVELYYPSGIECDNIGNIYISDTYNHRIRQITAASPTMSPSYHPTYSLKEPTSEPTRSPTGSPALSPSLHPTPVPTTPLPSSNPTLRPSKSPTNHPTYSLNEP
jgi:hypothetical protein